MTCIHVIPLVPMLDAVILNSGNRQYRVSQENELRSRVFAERLGLEYGWNCHISLANPSERRRSNPDHPAVSRDPPRTCRGSSRFG